MSIHSPGFVTVLVPVRNGAATIGPCIESILNLDYPSERREIVVVDNASTDATGEIIAKYPVRSIREDRRGLSNARNCGIQASRGDVIAFTDADCLVTTGWLTQLAQPFEEEDVSAVAGEILPYPSSTPAERYIAVRRPSAIVWTSHRAPSELNFASAGVRRAVFDRIGMFDPRFTRASEDIDLSWRFARSQLQVRTKPEAIVFHRNRKSPGALFKQQVGYGRELVSLAQKYPGELSWGWREELRAWKDIAEATRVACNAWASESDRNSNSSSYAYFDLVRKLGQRIGYVQGAVAAWAGKDPSVTQGRYQEKAEERDARDGRDE